MSSRRSVFSLCVAPSTPTFILPAAWLLAYNRRWEHGEGFQGYFRILSSWFTIPRGKRKHLSLSICIYDLRYVVSDRNDVCHMPITGTTTMARRTRLYNWLDRVSYPSYGQEVEYYNWKHRENHMQ